MFGRWAKKLRASAATKEPEPVVTSGERLTFTAPIEIQATASGDKPAKLSIVAYTGGEMAVPGFGPVVIQTSGLLMPASIPVLVDHVESISGIVGSGQPRVTGVKLLVEGNLAESDQAVQITKLARSGVPLQASVGVEPIERRSIRPGEKFEANGKAFIAGERGALLVLKGRLREVSIVAVGADASTSVSIAAKGDMTMSGELNGVDQVAAVRAEHARVAKIDRLCGANHAEIREQAIEAGWSPEQTELAVLRAARGTAGVSVIRGVAPIVTTDVLAAALLIHGNRDAVAVKAFGETVAQQGRDLRIRHQLDVFELALRAEGREIPRSRPELIRAAFSTVNLPTALSSTINLSMEQAYKEAPATWRSFAAIRDVTDFRLHTGARPAAQENLEQVGPSGELKHGVVEEEMTLTWKAGTYGKILKVTRTDLVNDRVDWFADMAPAQARAAARSLSDLVYSTILANGGNFFSAGNANYESGAGTALQVSALASGIKSMRSQRDADANDLDIRPAVLLVGPTLEQTAVGLLESEYIQRLATDSGPTGNTLQGSLRKEVESRLENSDKFTGTSTTAWYLFASPADAAVIVSFLDGVQNPTTEFLGMDSDPDHLGVCWRIFHDYGVDLGDPKAAYKAKGAA